MICVTKVLSYFIAYCSYYTACYALLDRKHTDAYHAIIGCLKEEAEKDVELF